MQRADTMEIDTYQPGSSEPEWQARWETSGTFASHAVSQKPKFYCLEMYPYPSGKMHMGHVRNYSIGDAVARYKRATGFNVIYPIGFDSFGMPAENAAIAQGGHPRDITEANIAAITTQIKRMGFSYDWAREVKSHDEDYYRWNQWFFLEFLERGLAYRDHAPVNWCDSCTTVLANEQVKSGRCWRCSAEVEQKDMSQWFLRITDYAQDLLDDLEVIDFPEKVRLLQQDWLGRSEGALIEFPIEESISTIETFTTRPDTIFGVTFLTLAPEHPLCEELVSGSEHEEEWRRLREESVAMSDFDRGQMLKDKRGVFLGRYALNPLSGERVPIYAGNFVLYGYGTGAVMAVPAHDQRDFEFAKRYGITIMTVLTRNEGEDSPDEPSAAFTDHGWMVNSPCEGFDGLYGPAAITAVIDSLEAAGSGQAMVQWKLRPWLISRQRYWGTPIPVIHCESCGVVPVPQSDLPVLLPDDVTFSGHGNPLESSKSFCDVDCPSCGAAARRETDTMDTFVDSSWYFLRYTDASNVDACFERETADYWMNVDFYCGGIEHAQMHLIYARFWTKALRDLGLHSIDEPFQRLLCQGMVNSPAPFCEPCGLTLHVEHRGQPCPTCGEPLGMRSAKMSKSLGNTVSPEAMVERYGADTVRLFMLFAAQPEAEMDWSDKALESAWRQLNTLHALPGSMLAWEGGAADIDGWMLARLRQRRIEWRDAMDAVNLRTAVQITHYDMLSDVGWYQRRGGADPEVGRRLLGSWAPMLQISTPHLAEDWWAMSGREGLLAGHVISEDFGMEDGDEAILLEEQYLRSFLEQARSVREMALRHMDGEPSEMVVQTAPDWKHDMARTGLEVQASGESIKTAFGLLQSRSYWDDDEIRAQVGDLWKRKMLPQLFRWNPSQKAMIASGLDEATVLAGSAGFICAELGLSALSVHVAGEGEDVGGKARFAFPLEPGVAFI